jgi:hypothetical protein
MPGFTYLNDVQVGQNTQVNVISRGHGAKRFPMVETFTFKPKKSAGVVQEMDNTRPVASYEVFDGVDINFATTQADQTDKIALMMDIDPNQALFKDDPATNVQLTALYVNFTGKNSGFKYGAIYAEQLRAGEDSEALTLKDPAKETLAFVGTWGARFFGKTGQKCYIVYARLVNTPVFSTTTDITLTGSSATMTTAAVAVPEAGYGPSGTTLNLISAFKNGQKMNVDARLGTPDITVASTAVTLAAASAAGDVWDVFYIAQA